MSDEKTNLWTKIWRSTTLPFVVIGVVLLVIVIALMGGGSGSFSFGGVIKWLKNFFNSISRKKPKEGYISSPKGDIHVKEDVEVIDDGGQSKVAEHLSKDNETVDKIDKHKGGLDGLTKNTSG